jgi:AICAR transformylase/IMP cyclohydrolase PurH
VLAELAANGKLSASTALPCGGQAFNRITRYDGAISNYLSRVNPEAESAERKRARARPIPGQFNAQFVKVQDLRYGENPHQRRPSTATCARRRHRWRHGGSCRARSCPTTTSPTPMPPGNA